MTETMCCTKQMFDKNFTESFVELPNFPVMVNKK